MPALEQEILRRELLLIMESSRPLHSINTWLTKQMRWFYSLLFRKCLGIPEPFLLLSSQYTPFSLEWSFVCLPQLLPVPLVSLTFEYPILSSKGAGNPCLLKQMNGVHFSVTKKTEHSSKLNRPGLKSFWGVCV